MRIIIERDDAIRETDELAIVTRASSSPAYGEATRPSTATAGGAIDAGPAPTNTKTAPATSGSSPGAASGPAVAAESAGAAPGSAISS